MNQDEDDEEEETNYWDGIEGCDYNEIMKNHSKIKRI